MRSNCVVVAALAALLLILGSSTGLKQESAGSSPDPALESTTGVGSTSPVSEAGPATVAGIWSLVLIDGATGGPRPWRRIFSQLDRVIFGRGARRAGAAPKTFLPSRRVRGDGGSMGKSRWSGCSHQDPGTCGPREPSSARYMTIGASGIVIGQRVNLDLIFLDQNALYRLDLTVFGSSVSGDYLAYEGGERSGPGAALGRSGRGTPSPSALPPRSSTSGG